MSNNKKDKLDKLHNKIEFLKKNPYYRKFSFFMYIYITQFITKTQRIMSHILCGIQDNTNLVECQIYS